MTKCCVIKPKASQAVRAPHLKASGVRLGVLGEHTPVPPHWGAVVGEQSGQKHLLRPLLTPVSASAQAF